MPKWIYDTISSAWWKSRLSATAARPDDVQVLVAAESIRLHFNRAPAQFEDMNGNIVGWAGLFVVGREAECVHIENGAMTTLAIHFGDSCRLTLQPESSSATKAFLKWHFSLSGPASANRQINVKPKERCDYLNTANNQVIASTISKRKALISRKKKACYSGMSQVISNTSLPFVIPKVMVNTSVFLIVTTIAICGFLSFLVFTP